MHKKKILKKHSLIPQIQPWINEEELKNITDVIKSTWITEGKKTELFEKKIKKTTSAKYAITMSNGTVALYCALKALDIGPGDEVIVPDLTFIATANSVILAGANPVFCDIELETFGLDPDKIEAKITSRTKAIMPVHLYGVSAMIDKIKAIAKKHNLKIIEDAAQGIGVKFGGRHVGSFGDFGVISFYGNKTITTGEGGVILTNNKDLAKKCFVLKNHGRTKKGIFIHRYIGFNFSFTDLQAAIGLAQLGKLDKIIDRKNYIRRFYVGKLKNIEQIKFPIISNNTMPVFWFTNILTDDAVGLSKHLDKMGIQTRRFFYPLHKQPCYKSAGSFPNSEKAYRTGLSLPSSVTIKDEDLAYVCEQIKNYFIK